MRRTYNKAGFTLSEVLLVLSVIGVVAALTIPTLIQKVGNDQYVSKLKKEYSTISQAFLQVQNDNGGDITSVYAGSVTNVMNTYLSKLNSIKTCGTSPGCFGASYDTYSGNAYSINIDTTGSYAKAILADGTSILFEKYSNNCTYVSGADPMNNTCGTIAVDLNGQTPPNMIGRDFFWFMVTKSGVYPHGVNGIAPCTGVSSDGCTVKVIMEGAINY